MTIVTKRETARALPIASTKIGVSLDGAGYQMIPGASAADHTAGTGTVSQERTWSGALISTTPPPIEAVTIQVATWHEGLPVFAGLRKAALAGTPVQFRMDTYGAVIHARGAATQQAAIAAPVGGTVKGGLVTFSGADAADVQALFTNDQVLIGDMLDMGATEYLVNLIEYDSESPTDFTKYKVYVVKSDGSAATTAAAADIDSFRQTGYRLQFSATVEGYGSFSRAADGAASQSTTLTFRPQSAMPASTILATAEDDSW